MVTPASCDPAGRKLHLEPMTANEFITNLKQQVCDGAADAVLAALSKPPGKRPASKDVRLSEWFSQQSSTDQAVVREIIVEAVEQAAFNLLAVLDGVAKLSDDNADSQYELRCITGDDSVLLKLHSIKPYIEFESVFFGATQRPLFAVEMAVLVLIAHAQAGCTKTSCCGALML